jgi:tRNA pseudouridine55 synthase
MLPVPKLSAIKVEGERLYAKARRGDDFEAPVREMTVYRAERMSLAGDQAVFDIDCAGGTYIRSVVGTLEDAYCAELVRTRVGELSLDDADPEVILDPLDVLSHLDRLDLSGPEAQELIFGRPLPAGGAAAGEPLRVVVDGRLLGVARVEDDKLVSETILASSLEELAAR